MRINFIGHATFELADGDTRVLIDPFLSPNSPVAKVSADDVEPTTILVTHGHEDHTADVIPVAQRTGAQVVAASELAGWFGSQGVEDTVNPNLGGTVTTEWGSVKLVPAWHTNTAPDGSSIGPPAGLIVRIGGRTIYHLGDTALFSDMKLIGERHRPDVALVPIGGHFTMDREDAAYACGLIGAGTVIPCHYDTFPLIETDAEAFKRQVESETDAEVVLLAPGESHEL
jgi:L-ascorbate metabolism protein UlaG (beta-lactamase superfamily)